MNGQRPFGSFHSFLLVHPTRQAIGAVAGDLDDIAATTGLPKNRNSIHLWLAGESNSKTYLVLEQGSKEQPVYVYSTTQPSAEARRAIFLRALEMLDLADGSVCGIDGRKPDPTWLDGEQARRTVTALRARGRRRGLAAD